MLFKISEANIQFFFQSFKITEFFVDFTESLKENFFREVAETPIHLLTVVLTYSTIMQ